MSSYIGDNPFLFFSYCHADREEVFRIADAVDKAGYRVWYDKAISGAELDDKPPSASAQAGYSSCFYPRATFACPIATWA